jgi:hypothetical protein
MRDIGALLFIFIFVKLCQKGSVGRTEGILP